MNLDDKNQIEAASVVADVAAALSGVPPKWRLPDARTWADADVVIGSRGGNSFEILKSSYHKLAGKGGRRALGSMMQLHRYLRNLAMEHPDALIVWVLAGNPTRNKAEEALLASGWQWWQL